MSKSYPQHILAISESAFRLPEGVDKGILHVGMEDFIQAGSEHLILAQRGKLEQNESFRQVLPYVVLFKQDDDGVKLIPYRRTSAGGEGRLHGNVSVGYGGHIDLADVRFDDDSVIDLGATIACAVARELQEEIRITGVEGEIPMYEMGLLLDNSNEVGRVHMGVVLLGGLAPEAVIVSNEEAVEVMEPMTPEELLASGLPLESWTEVVALQLVAAREAAEAAEVKTAEVVAEDA